jgi:hypothetical protein
MTKLVFLNPYKGRSDSSNMNFLLFWDSFLACLDPFQIRIPNPDPLTLLNPDDCAVQVRIQKEQVKEERQKFMKKKESLQNVEIKKKSATGICKTFNY